MPTITLNEFIANEVTRDIERGFALLVEDTVQGQIAEAQKNKSSRDYYSKKMRNRFLALEKMDKIKNVNFGKDLSVTYEPVK